MKKTINPQFAKKYLNPDIRTIGSFDSKTIKASKIKKRDGDEDTIPTLITSTLF